MAITGRRRLSTAQILSLLTGGIVLAVLTAAVAITRVTLSRSAVEVAQDRMTRAVRQLATVSATGLRQSQSRYAAAGRDPAIRRLLQQNRVIGER